MGICIQTNSIHEISSPLFFGKHFFEKREEGYVGRGENPFECES